MSAATASGPGANAATSALLNSLLAWWGCHEAGGNSRLDATGNGNALAETNGTVPSLPGLIGQAASFVKTNYLKQVASILTGGSFSITCWVNPTDAGSYTLMGQSSTVSNGIHFLLTATTTQFRTSNGSVVAPNIVLPAGVWSHLAGVYSANGLAAYLYINGLPQGSFVPTSVTYSGTNFALGALSINGSLIFNGLLQMAGVWGRALSGNEVAALYNGGAGIDYPFAVAG